MADMEQDQQFVEFTVKALVDHPEDVRTERKVDEMGVLVTLFVNQKDFGQVIGRNGQTAKALRTLLRIVGAKNRARVNLKIHEPEDQVRPERSADRTPDRAPEAAESDDSDPLDVSF